MSDKTRKIFMPIIIIFVGLIITAVLVLAQEEPEQVKPEAYKPLVRYQVAAKSNVQINVSSQGTVVPRTQSNVVSQVGGQIVSVSPRFAAGGFFNKGEIMLQIDRTDFILAKTKAELQVAQAELRLAREKEEAKLAKSEWEKVGTGEPSKLVLREPQLKEAIASLNAAKAGLEQAIIHLKRTEIRAPFASRIRSKSADVGQVINPGTPLGQIYAIDYAEVRLPLPDAELEFVDLSYSGSATKKTGVKLSTVFAGKKHSWDAQLVRLEGEIDPKSRMVHVVARVSDPYAKKAADNRLPLSVGMYVSAEIEGREYENVYDIDRSALRGKSNIWVIDNDNKLYIRPVTILRQEEGRIIVNGGIDDGEKICLSPLDAMIDGMDVRIEE
ncbi:MAG: efflux RND transporter periplasmic adaptor subunit [Calditrichaeota bacterium]|nr:efflux RND transporter periplasmic adaptor subunit [Calditrichota bacterium]